jgi:hypothetical protein
MTFVAPAATRITCVSIEYAGLSRLEGAAVRILNIGYRATEFVFASSRAMEESLERYTSHETMHFNAARSKIPGYLRKWDPDLVVIHHMALTVRTGREYERLLELLSSLRSWRAVKVAVTSDETWAVDRVVKTLHAAGVSHVFTFANAEAIPIIYSDLDDSVRIHRVLSAYVDPDMVEDCAEIQRAVPVRDIDLGSRLAGNPMLGDWGQLRLTVPRRLANRVEAAGMTADVKVGYEGGSDAWLRFLTRCRFQGGVETGSSFLDRDGSLLDYYSVCPDATLEEVHRLFPHLEGTIDYRALAPRHLEAVIARCGQILYEGEYSGVLVPERHYIPLRRDFGNLADVVERMKDETARIAMTERAYADIVESGEYGYDRFAWSLVALSEVHAPNRPTNPLLRVRNEWAERRFIVLAALNRKSTVTRQNVQDKVKRTLRPVAARFIGEDRLRILLRRMRGH